MLVAQYLYNLDMSDRLLPQKLNILQQMYASVCMLYINMHDPNTKVHDPNTRSSVGVELCSQLGV